MTAVPSPADMAMRGRASRSGSSWAGISPASWAVRNWAAITPDTASEFRASGAIASAGSVSDSAK